MMNMLTAVGAYAAISRQLGLPLIYPGSGRRVTEATDARLLARAIAWSGRTPAPPTRSSMSRTETPSFGKTFGP